MPIDMIPPREGKPSHMRDWDQWNSTKKSRQELQQELDRNVVKDSRCARAIDEGVGKILHALDETGQSARTLVVFTSDQGFAFGQHGLRMKVAPYDAALRAPLIVSMPGTIGEGKVCTTAVGGHDLIPTFFAFAGIDLPWAMHGRDLTRLLQNPERASDHPVLMTYTGWAYGSDTRNIPAESKHGSKYPWWVSYRRGDFKYIRQLLPGEIEELYQLDADPDELTNLAMDAEPWTAGFWATSSVDGKSAG
jgi:arylsulfatase A-like enzyme